MAARRPSSSGVLAARPGAGSGRRASRDRSAPAPALAPVRGARGGSVGALSAGRLLAGAAAAAGAPLLERLRLLVPAGAGRDRGPALRGSDRGRVRSDR